MQRRSDKHGPRQDDAEKHEVRGVVQSNRGARVEDWRDPEPSADDEPTVDRAAGTVLGGSGDESGIPRAAVEQRSELAAALRRTLFPAKRAELLRYADEAHIDDDLRRILEALPADVTFRTVEDVWEAHGQRPEDHRF